MKYGCACVLMLFCALLCGCGGGGGNSVSSVVDNSSPSNLSSETYSGNWSGTWTNSADRASLTSGKINFYIDKYGVMSGSMVDPTYCTDGILAGKVSENGTLTGTYTYAGTAHTINSVLSINDAGHLVGTVRIHYFNDVTGTPYAINLVSVNQF